MTYYQACTEHFKANNYTQGAAPAATNNAGRLALQMEHFADASHLLAFVLHHQAAAQETRDQAEKLADKTAAFPLDDYPVELFQQSLDDITKQVLNSQLHIE
ncbi:MAG: hypothetical protein GY805_01140 [Chloroflexi bacterium]|nr:hypothetical protein [Chloroflexota bacterium]